MGKRVDREGPIQIAIMDYLRLQFPSPQIVHHCKIEINKRGKDIQIEIRNATRKGVVTGFPDIIVLPYSTIGPMFFEVKAPGNYPSTAQKSVHADLEALGYRIAVVRSIDDVKECLRLWSVHVRAAE